MKTVGLIFRNIKKGHLGRLLLVGALNLLNGEVV